jgi:hypothetical protein
MSFACRPPAQQSEKVLLEDQTQNEQDHHAAQADVHSAEAESSPTASIILISAILDIVACPARCPAHRKLSCPNEIWMAVRRSGRFKILPFPACGGPLKQN